jgi:hypothetical protein
VFLDIPQVVFTFFFDLPGFNLGYFVAKVIVNMTERENKM